MTTKKASLKYLEMYFLISPTGEFQKIYDINECKENKSYFEIITKGKITSWKHTIKTEEIKL